MKILYITTLFVKEEEGSNIYTDLVESLAQHGHSVFIAMADQKAELTGVCSERGAEVLRIKTPSYYDVNILRKGLAFSAIPRIIISAIKKVFKNRSFDLILFEAPPATMSLPVRWAMKHFNAPSYLMLKDIFPQNGLDLNLYSKDSFIYKYFKRQEKMLYKTASMIGCMSEANKKYLLEHNGFIKRNKVEIFPNAKKLSKSYDRSNNFLLREKYSIPKDAFVVVMGGNMGRPQAMDFLIKTINLLKKNTNIFFLLIGRGSERNRTKAVLKNSKCSNYLILSNLPRDEYEMLLNECNAGIVLLDYRFTIPNFPSRILSYMEHSIPVLLATDKATDLPEIVSEADCGLSCYSNDINEFCKNIKILSEDAQLAKRLGANGRAYIEKNFTLERCVKNLERFVRISKG